MNNREAVNWLINISADIGKAEHSDLWHYEQALTEIKDMLESAQPEEAIPVSWIEAKIELVNSLPGVSMLKMKTADWRDLVEQWKAEQRSPEVDHDAQIREIAEDMSKHGIT